MRKFETLVNGNSFGPYVAKEIQELVAAGELSRSDFIRPIGSERWIPVTKVKGLRLGAEETHVKSTDRGTTATTAASAATEDLHKQGVGGDQNAVFSPPSHFDLLAVAIAFRRLCISFSVSFFFCLFLFVLLIRFESEFGPVLGAAWGASIVMPQLVVIYCLVLWGRALKYSIAWQIAAVIFAFIPLVFLAQMVFAQRRTSKLIPSIRFGFFGPSRRDIKLIAEREKRSAQLFPSYFVGIVAVVWIVIFVLLWPRQANSYQGDIAETVKQSMQESLSSDEIFQKYGLQVASVQVFHEGGSKYRGLADIYGLADDRRQVHQIVVQITVDGDELMWEAPPGSFDFLALEAYE